MKKRLLLVLLGALLTTVTPGCKKSEEEAPQEAKGPQGAIQLGTEARDFTLKTIDGETFNLASFKGKKVVVLGIGNPYG